MSALGLRMDDNTVRVAIDLRLGTAICGPHYCQLCGEKVNTLGRHALSAVGIVVEDTIDMLHLMILSNMV